MKMTGTLYAIVFCLGLTHLYASNSNIEHSCFIPATSYDASSEGIQGRPHHTHVIFDPLPSTLHELYQRNDKAKALHLMLHNELSRILNATEDRNTMLSIFADYGIGIMYEPNKHLVTTHLGIHGVVKSITTSFDSAGRTE